MSLENLIQVTNLSRRFGAFQAVKDLTFSLRRGEVLGFLGPNGAGKTTTMKMLCGALAPSAGRVVIGGHDLVDRPRQAKRLLGYLPETPPLYRDLTVDEYLMFCARIRQVRDVRAAVREVKQRCDLTDVGQRLIRHLSKGYQQRAGIAQAVLHDPAVVILDEPTSGLDPIQIREIRHLVRELGGEHSVILSTHILPEASSICDRVLIMNGGELVLDSPTAQVAPRSRTVLLGLRANPDPSELEAAVAAALAADGAGNGPAKVHSLETGHYRIDFGGDDSVPAAVPRLELLSDLAAARGWGLFELREQAASLEEVFIALTCAETSQPPAALPAQTAPGTTVP